MQTPRENSGEFFCLEFDCKLTQEKQTCYNESIDGGDGLGERQAK